MIGIRTTERSLRTARLQARLPRAIAAVAIVILTAAGLRATISGPPRAIAYRPVVPAHGDLGAESFAEGFARAYLTWSSDQDARTRALAPYAANGLDPDAGLQPAAGVQQSVRWTTVVGDRADGRDRSVTVEAQTSRDLLYLDVPVRRDAHGYLAIGGVPAIVGPPAIGQDAPTVEDDVADTALVTVAQRAVANFLAGNRDNLLADLTPDAVVSLPTQRLRVTADEKVTWADPGRRVAVVVDAQDAGGTSWMLRYELAVLRSDRWYVRSLQVDPTFQGGS